jgi:hypothetical protein
MQTRERILLATPSLFVVTGFEEICRCGKGQGAVQGCEYEYVLFSLNLSKIVTVMRDKERAVPKRACHHALRIYLIEKVR